MPKVLVVFHSRTGHTARLADAVADGARSVRFTEVDVRRLDDLAPQSVIEGVPGWKEAREQLAAKYRTLESFERLAEYDALVLGAPTRYGVMSAELKNLLDSTGPLWNRGALVDKVGGAFSGTATPHGGNELTIQSITTVMAHHGMILVPPGYTDPIMFKAGSPYGATYVGQPTDDDLEVARHQGRRVATVAEWVRHAKSHAHGHAHHH
jgi:NAD(P)H dehydrogenase (quinone)